MRTLPILKEYILRSGSRHRSVKVLKKLLKAAMLFDAELPAGDELDEPTRERVTAFRRRHHIPTLAGVSDGVVDEQVWAALGQYFSHMRLRAEAFGDDRLYSLLSAPPPRFDFMGKQPTCDERLAALFGGTGAVVMTRVEPESLLTPQGTRHRYAGLDRGDYGHSAAPRNDLLKANFKTNNRGGTIHIYPNPQGLPDETGLYVPAGFKQIQSLRVKGRVVQLKPGANNQKYFINDRLGITVVFAHVATAGVRLSGKNVAGSTHIGNIGGPEGDGVTEGYAHTHIVFYSEYFGDPYTGVTADPRSLFCK